MKYREYQPPSQLAQMVQCVWTMEGHASELEAECQPVLPDGRPELIIHLGDPFERLHDCGTSERQASVLFAGQLFRQLLLKPTGRIAVAAIRFRPDGAASLFRMPQMDLIGRTVSVQDVSAPLYASLSEVRSATDSPDLAAGMLLDRLVPRLGHTRPDPRIRSVVDAIARYRGLVSVHDLARLAGTSRRNLERRFNTVVGMSPKRLARVTRFQNAVAMLERLDDRHRGIRTAAECGYADQAHFIREFRDLAGCAPGAHLLGRGELTRFFTERPSRIGPDQ